MSEKLIEQTKLPSGCSCKVMEANKDTLWIEMTDPDEGLSVFTPSATLFVHKVDLYVFKQLLNNIDEYLLRE